MIESGEILPQPKLWASKTLQDQRTYIRCYECHWEGPVIDHLMSGSPKGGMCFSTLFVLLFQKGNWSCTLAGRWLQQFLKDNPTTAELLKIQERNK